MTNATVTTVEPAVRATDSHASRLERGLLIAALMTAPIVASHAQTADQATSSVLERAGRYVEEFERAFSGVVCE